MMCAGLICDVYIAAAPAVPAGKLAASLALTRTTNGAPQPIGMNNPNIRSKRTMSGEHFQKRLKGTILVFTRMKRIKNDEKDVQDGGNHRAASPLRAGMST